jgi:hypothetical protein
MTKRFIIQTLFAFMLILLVSCEKEEPATSVDLLMPINTGNSWTFKQTYYNWDGVHIDTSKLEIGEKVIIEGVTCYASISDSPNNAKFIVGNDETGNFVSYGGISDVDSVFLPSIEFKRDALVGDTWNYTSISLNWDAGTFDQDIVPVKCISVDTLITTPKGSFHCKGYEESMYSGETIFRYYLALNLGIVRMEQYENGRPFSYGVLIDYHLNK